MHAYEKSDEIFISHVIANGAAKKSATKKLTIQKKPFYKTHSYILHKLHIIEMCINMTETYL
jgi:hypothetical protein